MLPILALLCSRAFRLRAIRTSHHPRHADPRAPDIVSSEHDQRSTPAVPGAGELSMHDAAIYGASLRSCIRSSAIRTTLALQIRNSTQPSSPRGRRTLVASILRCSLRTHRRRQARSAASRPQPVRHTRVPHEACKAHKCPLPLHSALYAVAPYHAQMRTGR